MTSEADLLAAVIRDPEDDTVRLAYADWLEENGKRVRAEYIRAKIQGGTPRRASGPWPSWSADLRQIATGSRYGDEKAAGWSWEWRRGFVEEVRCPLRAWLDHGGAIVRRHPVTRVAATDREPYLSPGAGYVWHPSSRMTAHSPPSFVPDAVWRLCPGHYPDPAAARDALSAALLARARDPR